MARQLGFLNVYKPVGLSSHDVVSKLRRLLNIKQVGHGGTLDPLAEGVLPIAFGKACRLFPYVTSEKVYLAQVLLGIKTTTDDITGETISCSQKLPQEKEIRHALTKLVGLVEQKPPLYSAVRYKGKKLYELARKGILPQDIATRQVTIERIDLLNYNDGLLDLRIVCSKGTYIRAIARDLGTILNCGGCLKSLKRERSGPFKIEESRTLESLSELSSADRLDEAVLAPLDVLATADGIHFTVDENDARRLSMGQSLAVPVFGENRVTSGILSWQASAPLSPGMSKKAYSQEKLPKDKPLFVSFSNELMAICRIKGENLLHPEVVVACADTIS